MALAHTRRDANIKASHAFLFSGSFGAHKLLGSLKCPIITLQMGAGFDWPARPSY